MTQESAPHTALQAIARKSRAARTPPLQPALIEGEGRDPAQSQYFTPPAVADRMVGWLRTNGTRPLSILEPSGGNGSLIRAVARAELLLSWLRAHEPDVTQHHQLELACESCGVLQDNWCVAPEDFLIATQPDAIFDVALMNPPYERNQHVQHVARALEWAARVVALVPAAILHSHGRAEFWRWTDIRRMAVLSERPKFAAKGGQQDIAALELQRRKTARKQGAAHTVHLEWW